MTDSREQTLRLQRAMWNTVTVLRSIAIKLRAKGSSKRDREGSAGLDQLATELVEAYGHAPTDPKVGVSKQTEPTLVRPLNVGRLRILERPSDVVVIEVDDEPPVQRIIIRNHLEAETLARALERVFGENTFKVIRARSAGKRFNA